MRSPVIFTLAGIVAVSLAACGGGGSSNPSPQVNAISPTTSPTSQPTAPTATAAPSATPTPAAAQTPAATPTPAPPPTAAPTGISVSPASLSFSAAGTGAPTLSVTVAQPNNSAGFTLSTTTCSGIVNVSPAKGTGPFTFTALKAGTCSYIVTGNTAKTTTLPITVTTTIVQGQ